MPWLINEDAALKAKLTGLVVHDANAPAGRPIQVRFRLPEPEFADTAYPMLVIDHLSIERDPEREWHGECHLRYAPEGMPGWADMNDPAGSPYYLPEAPIPYTINYQVTLYTRKASHQIEALQQLAAFDRLPARFGYLAVPQDGTVRRLDTVSGPDLADALDGGKRVFTATWVLAVPTELFDPADVITPVPVSKVVANLHEIYD
jgi:hypothetical protein